MASARTTNNGVLHGLKCIALMVIYRILVQKLNSFDGAGRGVPIQLELRLWAIHRLPVRRIAGDKWRSNTEGIEI
jgi:hypothetical protein